MLKLPWITLLNEIMCKANN